MMKKYFNAIKSVISFSRIYRVALCSFFLNLCLGVAYASDNYSNEMLGGVKSAWLKTSQTTDSSCIYQKNIGDAIRPLVLEVENLGLKFVNDIDVSNGFIPDITILLSTESIGSTNFDESNICSYFIKIEAFHSMPATPRYKYAPVVLRVLVYRQFFFGASPKEGLEKYIENTSLHAFAKLAYAYHIANTKQ